MDSKVVIYAAIAGNFAIAITKFVAAAMTGSSAILSEGVHSLVDTGNSLLILLGIYLSQRPPNKNHPFGHGAELYFWSLIVAILIFGVGGGISIYEGILHILTPTEVTDFRTNYIVLAVSAVLEACTWTIAIKSFNKVRADRSPWQTIRQSKDPTVFMVLFEDSAALLGLAIAFVGLLVTQFSGLAFADGTASILIGLVLAAVASVSIYETRGLLIGESANSDITRAVTAIVKGDDAVHELRPPLTLQLGPEQILLALEIEFCEDLTAYEIATAVDRLEDKIREQFPQIKHIFLEAESITRRGKASAPNSIQT